MKVRGPIENVIKSAIVNVVVPFALLIYMASLPAESMAQSSRRLGALGIGAQAGSPTGLTMKYYARKDLGIILLGSWSLERFLLFSAHGTYEHPIPDSPLRFFIGPGIEVGREGDAEESDIRVSISLLPGINFFTERFEVFLQGLPGVKVIPETEMTLGGSVGLRYFF